LTGSFRTILVASRDYLDARVTPKSIADLHQHNCIGIRNIVTGRVCHAIEIAPAYVDVALKRWLDFTGQQAVLDSDGRSFDTVAAQRARRPLPHDAIIVVDFSMARKMPRRAAPRIGGRA